MGPCPCHAQLQTVLLIWLCRRIMPLWHACNLMPRGGSFILKDAWAGQRLRLLPRLPCPGLGGGVLGLLVLWTLGVGALVLLVFSVQFTFLHCYLAATNQTTRELIKVGAARGKSDAAMHAAP